MAHLSMVMIVYADKLWLLLYDIFMFLKLKYPNTRYGRGPIGGIRYS